MIKPHDSNAQFAGSFLPLRPKTIFTLWDMIQFFLHQFSADWRDFLTLLRLYEIAGSKSPGAGLDIKELPKLIHVSTHLHHHCKTLEMEKSRDRVWRFQNRLHDGVCTYSNVMSELQEIHNVICCELDETTLIFISREGARLFEKDVDYALFGKAVFECFPLARQEIKSAGNCLAMDEHTAAVFHLMRTVNIGFLAWAKNLGIENIGEKELPYCGDGSVIGKIEAAIDSKLRAINDRTHDEKWQQDLDLYRGLLVDMRFFKDAIRDPVFHARKDYAKNGGMDVYVHVRDFMQRLSKALL